jgi:uncharacterized protein (DUF1501 family)
MDMKRRDFIKTAGAAASIPLFVNGMNMSVLVRPLLFNAMNVDSDRVLVLVQLNGGNDGLNTLVPIDQYDRLFNARSNVLLPESSLIPVTDTLGFHPRMTGVKGLYDEGKLGIIQSVGYPNQNRSHFRSMEIWSSGSAANQFWPTGWLGRNLDLQHPGYPLGYPNTAFPHPFAISMGNFVSETCQGTGANYAMTLNDPFTLGQLAEWGGEPLGTTNYDEELGFLRMTIGQTNAFADGIVAAANAGNNLATYPSSTLATQLKHVARLIAGGLKTKIYTVSLGGFDTHSTQVLSGDKTAGEHAELLKTFSDAVHAFQQDLIQLGIDERVITMTFSEFGRQIRSNGSLGTDHGAAAPLFLLGSCVNPQILGHNPEIPSQVSPQEAVPMQYDFRDVYGSVLMDWFEVPEDDIRTILYQGFQHLPIVTLCNVTDTREQEAEAPIEALSFPNPFRDWTVIRFTSGDEWVRLSIFNALGSEIQVLSNQRFSAGEHEVRFDGSRLPAGNYYFRLAMGSRQQTFKMLKL